MDDRRQFLRAQQAVQWANHTADLDWMMTFLGRRGLGLISAISISAGALAAGSAALIAFLAPADELRPYAKPVMVAGVVLGVAVVARTWIPPFPGVTERMALVILADAVIGSACLSHYDPMTALAATSLMAIIGMFCVYYVNGWTHIVHAVIVVGVIATAATMCVRSGIDIRQVLPAAIGLTAISSVFLPIMDFYIWLLRTSTTDSLVDPLTGLANRRGVVEYVENLARRSYPRTLITIDVDGFKPVNDSLGHAEGDAVLQRMALTIQHIVRSGGGDSLVARTGGDEFAVITDVDSLTARLMAENIRNAVASGPYPPVTVSVGIATGLVTTSRGITDMMRNADTAMYTAKRRGGNMVEESPRRTYGPSTVRRRHQPSGKL